MKSLLARFKTSDSSELLKHTGNYLLSTIFIQAINFFSLPIFTRLLSVSEYGILDVWRSYVTIFFAVLTLNTYTALGRYYYEGKDDFKEFCGTSLIISLFCMVAALFGFYVFRTDLGELIGLPPETVIFLVPVVFFTILSSWFEQIFLPQKQSFKIAIRNAAYSLSLLLVSVTLVYIASEQRYMGAIYAQLGVGAVFSVYYYFQLRPYFAWAFRRDHLKYIVSYSVPLLPYSLGGIILGYFDRIMINSTLGASDAGLYSFAYNIGMLLAVFTGAVSRAWMPDYFKHMNSNDEARVNKECKTVFNMISAVALLLILFSKEIGILMVPATFYDSLPIIPVIVLGYLFNAIFSFYNWNIGYVKKTFYLSGVTLIGGALNIILNWVFLDEYGYKAAAFTTLFSFAAMAILGWFVSRAILKIRAIPLRLFIPDLLLLSPFILSYFVPSTMRVYWPLELTLKIVLASAYGALWLIPRLRTQGTTR